MLPATIDRSGNVLVSTRSLWQRTMPIANLVRATALPLPSLIEEIGFLLEDAAGKAMCVRETDRVFRWLAGLIEADRLFGKNWYSRAELGECIPAQLPKPAK